MDSVDDDMPPLEDNGTEEPSPEPESYPQACAFSLDDDNDDDEDDDEEDQSTTSLFGPEKFESAAACLAHMEQKHGFSMATLQKQWELDVYGSIKLVNFVRHADVAPKLNAGSASLGEDGTLRLLDAAGEEVATLAKDFFASEASAKYLQSSMEDDQLLLCCDGWSDDEDEGTSGNVIGEDMDEKSRAGLTESLAAQLKTIADESATGADEDDDAFVKQMQKDVDQQDDYYFDSYTSLQIHEVMLKDKSRTEGYRDAMLNNSAIFKDAVVLDVGCGTGILSIFAARAGAKKVYAIDACSIAKTARQIVKDNGLSDVITVIQGKVEDVVLPFPEDDLKQVDIIISEWMGYFLLFESMFASVIVARDRWLKPGGALYPGRCHMYLAPLSDEGLYKRKVEYWEDVYGVNMGAIRPWAVKHNFDEGVVEVVKDDLLMDAGSTIYSFDCNTVADLEMHRFSQKFDYESTFDGPLTGFCSWFDTIFAEDSATESVLSTAPAAVTTHWQQTTFYLNTPVPCKLRERIQGEIKVHRNLENARMLYVFITWQVGEGDTIQGRTGSKKWKF